MAIYFTDKEIFRWMKVLEQVEKGQLLCASSDDIFFEIIGFTSRLDIKNNCCQITFTCIHVFHINRVRGFRVDWNYYRYLIIDYRCKLNICIDTKHSQKRKTNKYQLRISIQYHMFIWNPLLKSEFPSSWLWNSSCLKDFYILENVIQRLLYFLSKFPH